MSVGAAGVARLAVGRHRIGFGRTFAERSGPLLTSADGVVTPFELGHTLEEFPTARTHGFLHAAVVVRRPGYGGRQRAGRAVDKEQSQAPGCRAEFCPHLIH